MEEDRLIQLMCDLADAKKEREDKHANAITLLLGDSNADASLRDYGAACSIELQLEFELGRALLAFRG